MRSALREKTIRHNGKEVDLRVNSFPTIIYVDSSGSRYAYTGERTVDAIASFVCHNSAQRHQFCRRLR